jgi:hypothetical protein
MSWEPISPELALVDPELGKRARAQLPDVMPAHRAAWRPAAPAPPAAAAAGEHRPYPVWARVTAALWLLVLGILIGGAAIPHAQEKPRVIPQAEDPTICKSEPHTVAPTAPTTPGLGQP